MFPNYQLSEGFLTFVGFGKLKTCSVFSIESPPMSGKVLIPVIKTRKS